MSTEGKNLPAVRNEAVSPPAPAPRNALDVFQPTEERGAFLTSLDLRDPHAAWLVQEIGNGDKTNIDTFINKTFTAAHFYVNKWSKTDPETGEYVEGLRVTLIGPRDEFLTFTGSGAIQALQRIASIPAVGRPPWNPPLTLEVGQRPIGNNRRMHTLRVTEEEIRNRSEGKPKPRK